MSDKWRNLLRIGNCLLLLALASNQCLAQDAQQAKSSQTDAEWTPPANASAPELFTFIEETLARELTGESDRDIDQQKRKLAQGVVAAATAALKQDLDKEQAMRAHYYQLEFSHMLVGLEDPNAVKRFEAALKAAGSSKFPEVAPIHMKYTIVRSFDQWPTWSDKKKNDLQDAIISYLQSTEIEDNDAHTVMTVADFMAAEGDGKLGRQLIERALPVFRKQTSPEMQHSAKLLEGVGNRLNLPGNVLELSGTLIDGSKLDWSKYKGKVVLVDFWASWCHPCREELPNVRRLYGAYHDKGFEVVGICIDKTKEEAEAAIQQLQIPWATLFSPDEDKRVWNDPLVVKYGVPGVPLAILLDKEGKVVEMNARGETLGQQLHKLLGEPLASAETPEDSQIKQVSSQE